MSPEKRKLLLRYKLAVPKMGSTIPHIKTTNLKHITHVKGAAYNFISIVEYHVTAIKLPI